MPAHRPALPELVLVAALSITAVGTAATGMALSAEHPGFSVILEAPALERWLPEAVALYGAIAGLVLFRGARREVAKAAKAARAAAERSRILRETEHANQLLVRSRDELERIAYAASHEMIAPLHSIGNLSDWLEEDLAEHLTTQARGHLDLLRDRAHQLERIVHGLQRLARAGRPQTRRSFDAALAIAEALDTFEVSGMDAHVVIDEGDRIVGDPDAFREIVAELIENAMRHGGREDVTVRVAARARPSGHELTVTDDGHGIAPAQLERVWGLFETGRARADGSGVGLARVRKLVEAGGGRAWVESPPGDGATFRCAWP